METTWYVVREASSGGGMLTASKDKREAEDARRRYGRGATVMTESEYWFLPVAGTPEAKWNKPAKNTGLSGGLYKAPRA